MADIVYTSGQIARICRVAPRTVSKWFDSGLLHGYRIPGGQDRRVMRYTLVEFMKAHSLPMDLLPGGVGGGGLAMMVGLDNGLRESMEGVKAEGGEVTVESMPDEWSLAIRFRIQLPNIVLADPFAVHPQFVERLRLVGGCQELPTIAVLSEMASEDDVRKAEAAGYTRVFRRVEVAAIISAVAGWRQLVPGRRPAGRSTRAEHKNHTPKLNSTKNADRSTTVR